MTAALLLQTAYPAAMVKSVRQLRTSRSAGSLK